MHNYYSVSQTIPFPILSFNASNFSTSLQQTVVYWSDVGYSAWAIILEYTAFTISTLAFLVNFLSSIAFMVLGLNTAGISSVLAQLLALLLRVIVSRLSSMTADVPPDARAERSCNEAKKNVLLFMYNNYKDA